MRFSPAIAVLLAFALAGSAWGAPLEVTGVPARAWGGDELRIVVTPGPAVQRQAEVAWMLRRGEVRIAGGRLALPRDGGGELRIATPQVRARTEVALDFVAVGGGEERLTRVVELFPRGPLEEFASAYPGLTVGLIDTVPGGAGLRRAPLPWRELTTALEVRSFGGRLVVVCCEEPLDRRSDVLESLWWRARGGLNVACLGGDWVGALGRPAEDVGGPVRVLVPGHALLANLEPQDLPDYMAGKGGALAGDLPGLNCLLVADRPGEEPAPVVVEAFPGSGRVLCLAMPLSRELRTDPLAERFLANVIRWGLRGPRLFAAARSAFGAQSRIARTLQDLGVHLAGGPDSAVTLGDSFTAGPRAEAHGGPAPLQRTVVLFQLSEDDLAALGRAVAAMPKGGGTARGEMDFHAGASVESPPGTRPEDLRRLDAAAVERGLQAPVVPGPARLVTPGGQVVRLAHGGGMLMIWQAPVEQTGPAARVLVALLTDMGVLIDARESRREVEE